jgi:hypothetical protein
VKNLSHNSKAEIATQQQQQHTHQQPTHQQHTHTQNTPTQQQQQHTTTTTTHNRLMTSHGNFPLWKKVQLEERT